LARRSFQEQGGEMEQLKEPLTKELDISISIAEADAVVVPRPLRTQKTGFNPKRAQLEGLIPLGLAFLVIALVICLPFIFGWAS